MKNPVVATLALVGLATAAWAYHPEQRQMERVKAAAHDLEQAARHVHQRAARDHRRALNDLEKQARHFHRQVEKYQRDPRHTERDFEALVNVYHRAFDELHHVESHVRDDFRDVEAHMQTLMDFYGGRGNWERRRGH